MKLNFKSSLIKKEDSYHQHPRNYFNRLIEKQTEFSDTFDDLMESISKGKLLTYRENRNSIDRNIIAFITIRDNDGINYVCVIDTDTDIIDQNLFMLEYDDNDGDCFYYNSKCVGSLKISLEKYISACSLGFNTAGLIILGEKHIQLKDKFILTGIFYIYEE